MQKFRRGDVVTIEVVVDSGVFGDGNMRVRQADTYVDIYVKASDLTMVRPKIEVGDMVTWAAGDGYPQGRVLSQANDHLWVDLGDGNFATVWIGKVGRLDPEPSAEAAAA